MDINMPGMDGLEATRRIRKLPIAEAAVPIIAVTASAMREDRQECLNAGTNDYLTKPIRMEALKAIIDRWTSGTAAEEGELYNRLAAV
jgi:CheY-like chemotaxis protein